MIEYDNVFRCLDWHDLLCICSIYIYWHYCDFVDVALTQTTLFQNFQTLFLLSYIIIPSMIEFVVQLLLKFKTQIVWHLHSNNISMIHRLVFACIQKFTLECYHPNGSHGITKYYNHSTTNIWSCHCGWVCSWITMF